MTPPQERIVAAIAQLSGIAEPDYLERPQAYTLEESAGFTRATSGENLIAPPELVVANGVDNIFATGFRTTCRALNFVKFRGDRNVVLFGPCTRIASADVTIEGSDNIVYLGALGTVGQVSFRIYGSNLRMLVGDRMMLSNRIVLGWPDRRALFSRATGERLDPPADIRIAPHCWVGRDVMIEPGTSIGQDSIVAQTAVVRGHFPNNALLVGAPARVMRDDITWARTLEDDHADTLVSKHHKVHFLQHVDRLKAHMAKPR